MSLRDTLNHRHSAALGPKSRRSGTSTLEQHGVTSGGWLLLAVLHLAYCPCGRART